MTHPLGKQSMPARYTLIAAMAALGCTAASAQTFLSINTMQPQVVFVAKAALPAPTNAMQANALCIPPAAGGDTCGIVTFMGLRLIPHTPILGQATGSMPVWKGNSIVFAAYDRDNTRMGMQEVPLSPTGYSMERLANLTPVVRSNASGLLPPDLRQRFVPPLVAPEAIANFKVSNAGTAPGDLKACTFSGNAADSGSCPALSFQGNVLVPFSFKDNRIASRLIGFDRNKNIIYTFDLPGIRYISTVNVDATTETVSFTGQNNSTVVMSFYDLPWAAKTLHAR